MVSWRVCLSRLDLVLMLFPYLRAQDCFPFCAPLASLLDSCYDHVHSIRPGALQSDHTIGSFLEETAFKATFPDALEMALCVPAVPRVERNDNLPVLGCNGEEVWVQ